MKKLGCMLTIIAMCFSSCCFSQEKNYKARAAEGGAQDSMNLSMVVWGVGLAVGIAALFLLLKTSDGTTSH